MERGFTRAHCLYLPSIHLKVNSSCNYLEIITALYVLLAKTLITAYFLISSSTFSNLWWLLYLVIQQLQEFTVFRCHYISFLILIHLSNLFSLVYWYLKQKEQKSYCTVYPVEASFIQRYPIYKQEELLEKQESSGRMKISNIYIPLSPFNAAICQDDVLCFG